MKPTDRMLLQLLSAAINAQNPTLDRALSDSEWNLVYGQAAKQGVLAVMWESVRRLPQDLQLVRSLKLQWAYGVEQIVWVKEADAGSSPFRGSLRRCRMPVDPA